MRVAVLADIHGNLPALHAVIEEVDKAGVDKVVLLGDIALGPMPSETLDRLAEMGDRAVWLRGNCDREIVTAFDGGDPPGASRAEEASWCAALITRRHRDRLDELPLSVTLEIDGLGPTLFCHASPRRDDEMLLVDSPLEQWEAALSGVSTQVVVVGHSHMPFDRLAAGHRVVNAGSVGMPYGPRGATWALMGPDVTLRRTVYDTTAAAAVISSSRHPKARRWAEEYVLEQYSDSEALRAFTEQARASRVEP
jgi:putative phosphoesterase